MRITTILTLLALILVYATATLAPCGTGACPYNLGCCVWTPPGSTTINQCHDPNTFSCVQDEALSNERCLCQAGQSCCNKQCFNPNTFKCIPNLGYNGDVCLCTNNQGCCNGQCYDKSIFTCILADNKPGKHCLCQLGVQDHCYFNYDTDHQTCYNNSTQTICSNGVVVLNTDVPQVTIQATKEVCGAPSTLTCASSNTKGAVTYQWTASNGGTITGATNIQTITASTAGTYTCKVLDISNCAVSKSFAVKAAAITTSISTSPSPSTCGSPVTLSCNAVGVVGTATYTWTTVGGTISGSTTSQIATATTSGTYTCTVNDSNGCSSTASQTITISGMSVAVTKASSTSCNADIPLTCEVTNSQGAVSYSWTTGSGGVINGAANTRTIQASSTGVYTCTATDASCTKTAQTSITVDKISASLSVSTQSACSGPITVTCNVANNIGAVTYRWESSMGTIAGPTTGQSISATSLGKYTCYVSDSLCSVVVEKDLVIDEMIVTVSSSASTTCGDERPILTCNAQNPTGDVKYSWVARNGGVITGQTTSQIITADATGTYECSVTDSLCTFTASKAVAIGTLGISVTPKPATACSGVGGTLTCTATNPQGAVSYLWTASNGGSISGPTNAVSARGVTSGDYQCTVTDGVCTLSASTDLTVDTISVSVSPSTTTTCNGPATLVCNVANNIGAVSYIWTSDGGNILGASNTQTIVVSSSATYTCTATDSRCAASGSSSVTVDALAATITKDTSSTCGGGTAQLTCNAHNAVGAVSYSWSTTDGTISGSGTLATIRASTSGTYTCTVTDSACSSSVSETIVVNKLSAIVSTSPVTVCGSNPTTLVCSSTNAEGAVSYLWTTTNGQIVGASNTATITINKQGTYKCTVTDTRCSSSADQVVYGDNFAVSIAPTPAISCDGSSVQLTCNPTSASGAVSYTWTTSNGGDIYGPTKTQTITATKSGTYICTASDTACSATASTDVGVSILGASITPDITSTCGSPAQLTCNAINSNGTVEYLWTSSDGAITGSVTAQTITATKTGTYSCTVKDATCSAPASKTIIIDTISAKVTPNPATSCQGPATLVCQASNSNGITTYSWTATNGGVIGGVSTGQTISATKSGTYTCTVSDGLGCRSNDKVDAIVDNLSVSVTPSPATSCNGPITLSCNAANAQGPITYSWSTVNGAISGLVTTQTITATATGDYTCTVSDSICTRSASTSAIVDALEVAVTSEKQTLCAGATTVLTCTASNPTGSVSYKWIAISGTISGSTTSQTITATAGKYTCTVTDSTCSESATKEIQLNPLSVSVSPKNAKVCGGSTTLTCNACGITGNAVYSWTATNGGVISGSTDTAIITAAATGTYTCQVTDSVCSKTDTTTVTLNSLSAAITAQPEGTCNGEKPTLTCTPKNAVGAVQYKWTVSNGGSISGSSTSQSIVANTAGVYTCQVTDSICSTTAQKTVETNNIQVSVVQNGFNFCGKAISLSCIVTGMTGPITYSWSATNGGKIEGTSNTKTVSAVSSGLYTCTVSDGVCTKSGQTMVTYESLTVSVTPDTAAICKGSSTTLTCNVSKAKGKVRYQWVELGGKYIPRRSSDDSTLRVTEAGTYQCTATDAVSSASDSTVVTIDNLDVSVSPSNLLLPNGGTAVLTCGVTGAVGNPKYTWYSSYGGTIVGATNTKTITISSVGKYTCKVSDSVCSDSATSVVTGGTSTVTITTDPSCGSSCNGNIRLTCETNNCNSAVTYSWSTTDGAIYGSNKQKTIVATKSGTYTCVANDGFSSPNATKTVTVSNLVEYITASPSASTCGSSVTLTCSVTGASGQVKYLWTSCKDGAISGPANQQTITVTQSGEYTCQVQDASCTVSKSQTVNISPLKVSITPNPARTCDSPATLTCNVPGACDSSSEAPTCTWTTSNGGSITGNKQSCSIIASTAGTYTCQAAYKGCTATATTQFTTNNCPTCKKIKVKLHPKHGHTGTSDAEGCLRFEFEQNGKDTHVIVTVKNEDKSKQHEIAGVALDYPQRLGEPILQAGNSIFNTLWKKTNLLPYGKYHLGISPQQASFEDGKPNTCLKKGTETKVRLVFANCKSDDVSARFLDGYSRGYLGAACRFKNFDKPNETCSDKIRGGSVECEAN